jgi:hypothetical protein
MVSHLQEEWKTGCEGDHYRYQRSSWLLLATRGVACAGQALLLDFGDLLHALATAGLTSRLPHHLERSCRLNQPLD